MRENHSSEFEKPQNAKQKGKKKGSTPCPNFGLLDYEIKPEFVDTDSRHATKFTKFKTDRPFTIV